MKKYLQIKSHSGMPIRAVEVTGRTEREVERIERGILIGIYNDQLDDSLFVELVEVEDLA